MTIQINYLGWSTFQLISTQGTKIVTDPFLVGNPKRGILPAVAQANDLTDTDLITVTHSAVDHNAQTVELMSVSKATLCSGKDVYEKAVSAGVLPERAYHVPPGARFKFRDVHVKALEASHTSISLINGQWITGVPLSFIIDFGSDGKVFFSGDNALGFHYRFIGEMYQPDLAILGIGGVMQSGQYLTELYPDEAAVATRWLNVKAVIPMHYLGSEAEEFQGHLKKEAQDVRLAVMKAGESVQFSRSHGFIK